MHTKFNSFVLIVISSILAITVMSCEKVDYSYSITMTALDSDVSFSVNCSKFFNKVKVDWGDGNIEKYDLGFFYKRLEHEYLNESPKIIKITGFVENLICNDNRITNLDVSNNSILRRLECGNNQLTSLDVNKNTALENLFCDGNQLTSLDVSKNTALENLFCDGNQLTSLDVSNNTALGTLNCRRNTLTSLDVSNNTLLDGLRCSDNQLTTDALNALFGTLGMQSTTSHKYINIGGNPGTSTCDRSIASNRGWIVVDY